MKVWEQGPSSFYKGEFEFKFQKQATCVYLYVFVKTQQMYT